eukprot:2401167-Pyramimonas_sp.AAC.1
MRYGSRRSAAHLRLQHLQGLYGFAGLTSLKWCFGTMQGCSGATVAMIRCVEVSGTAFWYDSGLSWRSRHVMRGVEVPGIVFRHGSG